MTKPKIDPNVILKHPMKLQIYCGGVLHREIFIYTPPINGFLNTEFEEYLKPFDRCKDYEVYINGCLYDISSLS